MLSMEVPAEEFVGSSNDQTVVMRGKRTKRHRPASPFGLAMTCSSSSGGSASSPTTSGGEVYESTEEEEDMANCLILLAQGGVSNGTTQQATHQERCGSRKFTEIMAATAVKVGFYVYECKTCNRTFPSFQALGGHRASHKKSKTASEAVVVAVEEKGTAVTAGHIPVAIPIAQSGAVAVDHRQLDDVKLARNCHSPPLSLQFGNHGTTAAVNGKANNNSRSNKTHECSICGSEFSSGQALGGHMRRHRTAAVASATTTTTTHQPTTIAVSSAVDYHHHQHHGHEEEKRSRNILQLDLNLPAPEDDLRDPPPATAASKFQFSSAKQSIVFSAPALVDCHY